MEYDSIVRNISTETVYTAIIAGCAVAYLAHGIKILSSLYNSNLLNRRAHESEISDEIHSKAVRKNLASLLK